MEWQPIETAPKDGTWVDLYRAAPKFGSWATRVTARWYKFDDGEEAFAWPDRDFFDFTTEEGRLEALEAIEQGDCYEANNFTHWMPLPTPPQSGK